VADEPARHHVGLVGQARARLRRGGLVLQQPVQLGQRPRGRQLQPLGLLARAAVVVHEPRRQRRAVAVDEQDRPRGRARRDGADARRVDRPQGPAAGAGHGVPPAAGVLLVAVAVAAAAQRRGRASEDAAAGVDRERPRAAGTEVEADVHGLAGGHSRGGSPGSGGGPSSSASGASCSCHHETSCQAPAFQPMSR
jgi:hypothetical protein